MAPLIQILGLQDKQFIGYKLNYTQLLLHINSFIENKFFVFLVW